MQKKVNFRGYQREDGLWYAATKDREIEAVGRTKEELFSRCAAIARMGQKHFVAVQVDLETRQ